MDAFSATLWACRPNRDWFTTGEILFDRELRKQQLASSAMRDVPSNRGGSDLSTNDDVSTDAAFYLASHSRSCQRSDDAPNGSSMPTVAAIFACEQTLTAQLDHFQYLFILRLIDALTDMQKQVESDILRITGKSP